MGFWTFPDTGVSPPGGGADGFPHLRELTLFGTDDMLGGDLDRSTGCFHLSDLGQVPRLNTISSISSDLSPFLQISRFVRL